MSLLIDYERIIQEVYEAILQPGDTAVDIGAHVGRHSIPLARCVGPAGKVIAIEPLPGCREQLQQRLVRECPELVAAVEIVPLALSDQAGIGMLFVAEDLLAHSGLRETPYPIPTRISRLPIQLETLDELCCEMETLHYVKLDAEGAELPILRGAAACLEKFRPVVSFEFGTLSNREFGTEPMDMARFWSQREYHVYAITGERLDEVDFESRARARDIWDYVAVPCENFTLNQRIRRVLNRPRVHWLAVRAQLNHANDHAEVGAAVPSLRRFRGPLWPLARGMAWMFLAVARLISIPQRLFNRALLLAFDQLVTDLEMMEREGQRQDRSLHEIMGRLELLEKEVARLHQPSEQPWPSSSCEG